MRLAGLDIATKTGLARVDGEGPIIATSFRPSIERPAGLKRGEVDFTVEGKIQREHRDFLRAWLLLHRIEAVGIEKPMIGNKKFRKPIINRQASFAGQAITYQEMDGTSFGANFRTYQLVASACEVCARLNIPIYPVSQDKWRMTFMGVSKGPNGINNKSQWLKERARMQCERLGIEISNNDESDACGIVFWLRGHLNPRIAQQVGLFASAS